MGIIIGVVVLAVIAGIVVVAMKGKSSGTSGETTASSAEAIARVAPQTTPKPAPTLSIPKPESEPAPRPSSFVDDPVPFTKPSASLPRLGLEPSGASATPEAPAAAAPAAVEAPADEHEHDGHEDEAGFDRFGAPGQRAKLADDDLLSKPLWEVAGGAVADGSDVDEVAVDEVIEVEDFVDEVIEAEVEVDEVIEAGVEVDEVIEAGVEVDEVIEAEVPVVDGSVAEVAEVAVDEDAEVEHERFDPAALVIEEPELVPTDLATVAADEAPAPVAAADPVDHVLNALINRAKERQVGIAQVAAELVEQADLEDKEVDEVLADLLGVAESEGADAVDRPELTLFSDAVPQRPGQLTDFARLPSTEKKRALIRVLCLLVALQEEHKLEGRDADEPADADEDAGAEESAGARSWPLARAVWPVKTPQRRDDDRDLPGRSRLAKTR